MSIGIVLQKSSALRSFSVSEFVIKNSADFVLYRVSFFIYIYSNLKKEVDNTGMEEKAYAAAES